METTKTKERSGPPDGGWSWAVLASAFLIAALLLGMGKATGVLYTAIPHAYDINRSATASLTSVNGFVRCIMGPVSGALCTRFANRQVVAAAGILSAAGLITAAFSPNLAVFAFGYCLIYGIGSGLTLVPTKLVITKYFDKRRNLALGITFTGNCAGGMAMPPLIEALYQTYGLQGTLLMMGAIILHLVPCAMVFFPLPNKQEHQKEHTVSTETIQTIAGSKNQINSFENMKNRTKAIHLNRTQIASSTSSGQKMKSSTPQANGLAPQRINMDRQVSVTVTECPHHAKDVNRKPCQSMDWSVLKNGYYLLIAFSACSPALAYSTYIMVMPDYALQETDDGIERPQAALLLTLMSAGDFFGRLISSWVGNQKNIPLKYGFVIGLTLMSCIILLLPYIRFYIGLLCFSAIFGMTAGISLVMPTFLINEYIPSEKWPTAYGFSFFFLGVPLLILAPVIGFLRDLTGSYVVCFWLMACITFAGAVAWTIEIIIDQHRKRKDFKVTSDIDKVNNSTHYDDIVRL